MNLVSFVVETIQKYHTAKVYNKLHGQVGQKKITNLFIKTLLTLYFWHLKNGNCSNVFQLSIFIIFNISLLIMIAINTKQWDYSTNQPKYQTKSNTTRVFCDASRWDKNTRTCKEKHRKLFNTYAVTHKTQRIIVI